jgi:hypothetical protein
VRISQSQPKNGLGVLLTTITIVGTARKAKIAVVAPTIDAGKIYKNPQSCVAGDYAKSAL